VIPGGAYTALELIQAQERDPVVAGHYRGFQRNRLRTVQAAVRRPVYVSYRRGESIYWTHRPVYLHDGETLLTDGVLYARARCGNRISETPQQPVDAAMEPPPEILDTPGLPEPPEIEAVLPVPDVVIAEAKPIPEEEKRAPSASVSAPTPRYYNPIPNPIIGGGAPLMPAPPLATLSVPKSGSSTEDQKDDQTSDQQEAPEVTPEPGSFLFLLTGSSVLMGKWLYSRRQRPRGTI
jgi:hypothetical protein